MSPSKALLIGVVGAVAAVAGLIAAQWTLTSGSVQVKSGTLLQNPRPIAEFTLTDAAGQAFDRERFGGHWSVLFAGFTSCPDVCPTTLAVLKDVKAGLDAQHVPLEVVFISVDPQRDTPDKLAHYVHHFSPAFVAATGPAAELDKLTESLSLVYAKVPGETPDTYTMDHSSALVLIDPQARVAGYFLPPLRADTLIGDLRQVVQQAPAT